MLKVIKGTARKANDSRSRPKLRLVHGGGLSDSAHNADGVDLGDLIIRLIKECGAKLAALKHPAAHTISLGARLSSGIHISADAARCLEFVICEIITNAYCHAHPGGAPVEVTLSSALAANGNILIEIGDDGIGLPAGFAEWRDAGNGIVSIRVQLQKIGAALNVTSDDLGLRFQIVLGASAYVAKPARDTFVWL